MFADCNNLTQMVICLILWSCFLRNISLCHGNLSHGPNCAMVFFTRVFFVVKDIAEINIVSLINMVMQLIVLTYLTRLWPWFHLSEGDVCKVGKSKTNPYLLVGFPHTADKK